MQTFSNQTKGIKAYVIALSVLSLGVVATALAKMAMYINEYGMTQLRVYTSWFMLVMTIIFLLIIANRIKEFKFWRVLFVSFTAMFFMLCFFDVNGLIAKYNISAYESGRLEELDVYSMQDLGYSAAEPIEELINNGNADGNE